MEWDFKWGAEAEDLQKFYRLSGNMPKALQDRPIVDPAATLYYHAFNRLSASRQSSGFGVQPLTLSDMLSYCRLIGLAPGDDSILMVDMLQIMDCKFLKAQAAKVTNTQQ